MFTFRQILIFLSILFVAGSCRLRSEKEWDVDLLTPIAHGKAGIQNIVADSLLKVNADKSLSLVYVNNLSAIDVGDIIQVPDTELKVTVSLKTISLGNRQLTRNITLGEVARNSGFTGQLILLNQGNSMVIPPLTGISTGPIDINAQSFFETATFTDGKLKMEIHNGFPVELDNIHYQLRNKTNDSVIVDDQISSLMPGADYVNIYSLAEKTVEGKLVAQILNMNSPGSNGNKVPIDTNDALNIRITAYDMQVFSARAIFPAQNLVNDSVNIPYNLNGALIRFMKVKRGDIKITASHTIHDSLKLNYTIPGATLVGNPLNLNRTVPPVPAGKDTSSISEIYPIDNYDVDLTGRKKDTFNTFFNILTVRIDSTGKMENLSLKDSIYLKYGLYDVVPEYARGYLGQVTYHVGPQQSDFSGFRNLRSGEIKLEDVIVNLNINNGVGAPGRIKILSLKSINSTTGKSVSLTGSILSQEISVAAASDYPFTPAFTNIRLDKSNSNIPQLLDILPDKLEYELQVDLNPNGNSGTYTDFIYDKSSITADLNIEIPMNGSFSNLTLEDTSAADFSGISDGAIQGGTIHAIVNNSFPLTARFQFYTLSDDKKIEDSLITGTDNTVSAGIVNSVTGLVIQPTQSKIDFPVDQSKWSRIKSKKLILIRVILNTSPSGQPIKLYSTYGVEAKISANVKVRNRHK